ncbi:hypothetical protein [Chryseobacterium jejuense]|uniref:Uncharacterized protein n=1 Tax=Chryseobacterium jejuense TaxID=445960 RepID=A0A2X2VCF8_CHRJE|nr:hypothetical protein [Chryseobacterium jejuense]SDJ21432.1 hypothetical protein SAMN05421542_3044 [Chryseobacterium jejuense]SQB28572.1 Uncharacterised protein [Chryseobacterium jejuense]
MPTSKMSYKEDKGFWIEESFMQLVFHYIYKELIKSQYNLTNKNQLLEEMKFDIDGYTTGSMSLGWRRLIESSSDIQTLIQVLEHVKLDLNSKGMYISVQELQNIQTEDNEFKYYYTHPFPISGPIKIVNALIQMLNGTWTATNEYIEIDIA